MSNDEFDMDELGEREWFEELIARLENDDDGAIAAADKLGESGDLAALDTLVALAWSDRHPVVRAAAVNALGGIGGAFADEVCLAALDDPAGEVRAAAAVVLAERWASDESWATSPRDVPEGPAAAEELPDVSPVDRVAAWSRDPDPQVRAVAFYAAELVASAEARAQPLPVDALTLAELLGPGAEMVMGGHRAAPGDAVWVAQVEFPDRGLVCFVTVDSDEEIPVWEVAARERARWAQASFALLASGDSDDDVLLVPLIWHDNLGRCSGEFRLAVGAETTIQVRVAGPLHPDVVPSKLWKRLKASVGAAHRRNDPGPWQAALASASDATIAAVTKEVADEADTLEFLGLGQ